MTSSLDRWPTKAKEAPSPHGLKNWPCWTPTQYLHVLGREDSITVFWFFVVVYCNHIWSGLITSRVRSCYLSHQQVDQSRFKGLGLCEAKIQRQLGVLNLQTAQTTLTPSNLLKVTKFLLKTPQFKFLVITEKNIFIYKLFLSLKFDVSLFFM